MIEWGAKFDKNITFWSPMKGSFYTPRQTGLNLEHPNRQTFCLIVAVVVYAPNMCASVSQ